MSNSLYSKAADTKQNGSVRVAYAYSPSLSINIGEYWEPVKLPGGRRVKSVRVRATGTTSRTLSVGDSGSATRFINAASTATSVILNEKDTVVNTFTNGQITAGLGFLYDLVNYPNGVTIRVTCGGANISAKAHAIWVEYVEDHSGAA